MNPITKWIDKPDRITKPNKNTNRVPRANDSDNILFISFMTVNLYSEIRRLICTHFG